MSFLIGSFSSGSMDFPWVSFKNRTSYGKKPSCAFGFSNFEINLHVDDFKQKCYSRKENVHKIHTT